MGLRSWVEQGRLLSAADKARRSSQRSSRSWTTGGYSAGMDLLCLAVLPRSAKNAKQVSDG